MRVLEQVLPPGVKQGEEANAGAQMLGIGCNRFQRHRARAEQRVVDQTRVLQCQRIELLWNGEDHMEVFNRQQFSTAPLDPLRSRRVLALRAMAIAARIIAIAFETAVTAAFFVSAKDVGPAGLDGAHDSQLLERHAARCTIRRTVLTEDAGHFQRGPVHGGYNAAGFCFVAGLLAAGLRSAGLTTCFIARGVTAV